MIRYGKTLDISCDPKGLVMLSCLVSFDASNGDLEFVCVVREYSDVFDEVRGLPRGTRYSCVPRG